MKKSFTYDESGNIASTNEQTAVNFDRTVLSETNKEFWDSIYQNSLLNLKTKYNSLSGDKVCLTCPIDRTMFTNLYHESAQAAGTPSSQAPPRVTIAWAAQFSENRLIFFCRNNTKIAPTPVLLGNDQDNNMMRDRSGGELDYSCENNRLCLINAKYNYPETYQCYVKSYVYNVKLNVIVQLQYVLLYFTGDSVKFDYQKEVQVHENQVFTVKCEVPESNPVSNVNAYIDNRELKLTKLEKKTVDNRMSINTYSFDVNATRSMNGKRVKCEAQMKDLPSELANSIDLRSHISKDYSLSVFYLPTCVYRERTYRTGINRSIIIECPINGSNPDVTYYKMIPPSTRTKFELIDSDINTLRKVGRYRINPSSIADFGLYECIPRSLAGTAKCDIIVELGSTPNPPEQCSVQFAKVNNKTFAQFSCRPGHNQGGLTSFLTIYEMSPQDKSLKLSGRVNIDESKIDKEVPYITPADEDKYYEFLIMQENNFGNSSSVMLTLGTSEETKVTKYWDSKTLLTVAGIAGGIVFLICLCGCCCCTDVLSGSKSDNPCCKCCAPSDNMDEDGLTYKKAPLDAGLNYALVGTNSGNQSYPAYSSDLNNMGNGKSSLLGTSTYEYYDNTSTGLLSEGNHYSRHQQYQDQTHKNRKLLSYEANHEDDNYIQNYNEDIDENELDHEEDEDHYMNHGDHGRVKHYLRNEENDEENYSENADSTSSEPKSDDQQSFIPQINSTLNNNSNTLGKKNPYLSFSQSAAADVLNTKTLKSSSNNMNPNNYSTIDSKNLKLIKTENGLVYTPLNTIGRRNKSNDELINEEEDDHYQREGEYEGIENTTNTQRRFYDSKKVTTSTYSNVKKITQINQQNKNPGLNNNSNLNHPYNNNITNVFQNELTLKLKTITATKDGQTQQMNGSDSNNMISKQGANQSEQLSNSTATTSVSSASSSCSNSELNTKMNGFSTNTAKRMAPIATEQDGAITVNKTYSLLKTTLNLNGVGDNGNENNMATNTLNKSQPKLNGHLNKNQTNGMNGNYTNGTTPNGINKPPILKPKPRANNVYQTNAMKKHLNIASDSIHNQSIEPLLNQTNNNNNKEISSQTSPSTSVTDVSSNNCTPQHYNSTLIEEIVSSTNAIIMNPTLNNLNSNNKQPIPRSRSNSLTRPHHRPPGLPQTPNHVNGNANKTTTTFSTNSNNNNNNNNLNTNGVYSSNKLVNGYSNQNGDQLNISQQNTTNGIMRTFSQNGASLNDNNTLSRKLNTKKPLTTIDDEIKMMNNNYTLNGNTGTTKKIIDLSNPTQRTLERRHVKNSEC